MDGEKLCLTSCHSNTTNTDTLSESYLELIILAGFSGRCVGVLYSPPELHCPLLLCSKAAIFHWSGLWLGLFLSSPLPLAVPVIFQLQQWQEGCKNRAGGGHPEVCTGTGPSILPGGFGSLLRWCWGWGRERLISCAVTVGDEAGKCCLSLMLHWAHGKLNGARRFSVDMINGGHWYLNRRSPLRLLWLAATSIVSLSTARRPVVLPACWHTMDLT